MRLRVRLSYLVFLSLSAGICTVTSTLGQSEELLQQIGKDEYGPASKPAFGLAAGGLTGNGYVPTFNEQNLGGEAMSRPCCVLTEAGQIDCFLRSPRSHVWQKTMSHDSAGVWNSIGGVAASDIECLSAETLYVFVLGKNDDVAVNTFDTQGQRKWVSLGASLPEVPTCISTSDTRIDCVLQDYLTKSYRVSHTEGDWGAFVNLGTPVLKQPFGCGKLSKTRFDCFAVDRDQQIVQVTYNSGKWSHQVATNASVNGRLSVVWTSHDRLDLVGLGPKNDVVHMTWTPDQWSSAVSLGGVFDTDPHCLGLKEGIHCFAVGPDSKLYYNGWNTASLWVGSEWSKWSKCPGTSYYYIGPPYCISTDDDEISCFVRSMKREVVRFTFNLISNITSHQIPGAIKH